MVTKKDGRKHFFDADGKILARVARGGQAAIQFVYHHGSPDLARVIDSRGQVFEVDSLSISGRIASITDPLGREITYHYDGQGNLERVDFPATAVLANDFTSSGEPRITPHTSASVQVTSRHFEYYDPAASGGQDRLFRVRGDDDEVFREYIYGVSAQSRVASIFNALGGEWRFSTDPTRGVRIVVDPRGFKSEATFNAEGRVVQFESFNNSIDPTMPRYPGPESYIWTYTPEPNCDCGLSLDVTTPDGVRHEVVRSASSLEVLRERTYANDGSGDFLETAYTYDGEGRLKSQTTPLGTGSDPVEGYRLDVEYTELVDHPQWPGGTQVTLSRPLAGGSGSIVWERFYDRSERIVEVQGPDADNGVSGYFRRYEYHGEDHPHQSGLLRRVYYDRQLTRWTEFEWDPAGRVIRGTRSDGAVYQQEYDRRDRVVRIRNAANGGQQYELHLFYDAEGRRSKERYTYFKDSIGAQGAAVGPDGWVEHNFWFDLYGNVVAEAKQVTEDQHAIETVEYDLGGLPVMHTDADGLREKSLYNGDGELWRFWEAYGESGQKLSEFVRGGDGQILYDSVDLDDERRARTDYSYDRFGRLIALEMEGRNRVEVDLDDEGRTVELRELGLANRTLRMVARETYEFGDPWHEGATSVKRYVFDHKGMLTAGQETEVDYLATGRWPRCACKERSSAASITPQRRAEVDLR